MKAIFTGITTSCEYELIECGYSTEDIQTLIDHEGEECEVKLVCLVDEGDFESNYYSLEFEDGFKFDDLSGLYLERI